MKKTIFMCLLFLLSTGITSGQTTTTNTTTKQTPSIDGTYQIQMINTRNKPNIPGNLNQLVLENRDATQVKYISLGTEVRLKILPLSEINKPDFKPLTMITHVPN